MDSGNTFDDEKTIFIDLQSDSRDTREENLLFFLGDDPENKLFLQSGEGVTVGRSIESDFFIENKTISRKHLTITRQGHGVNIEIHGRNGLYMDDELHMGPLVDIKPPLSFTIGDVACSIELEIDEDATIIVTADQRVGMKKAVRPQAQPNFHSSPEPGTEKSFAPSPNDTFIPSDIPSEAPVLNEIMPQNQADYRPTELKKQAYTAPPEPAFEQPAPGMAQTQFEPVPKAKGSLGGEKLSVLKGIGANKNNMIIAGIIAVAVLIIIFIFFILFTGQPDKSEPPLVSPQKISEQAPSTPSDGAAQNSHQTFFDLANELIKSGDTVTARDVLNDIPEDSPYYSRAKKLLEKLPEN